jgi:hypothetical protein
MDDDNAALEQPLGARFIAGQRRSHRIESKRRIEARILRAYRLSVAKALKKYDNISLPTVAQETVMMVLAIAAIEKRKIATIDTLVNLWSAD